jgi:hypothetical protein
VLPSPYFFSNQKNDTAEDSMGKRIGKALIERGLITPQQLDKALKAQLIFGGHLGTNLIELGFIDEEALGTTLAEILGVRHATREDLLQIPEEVIDLIPRELAERQGCIPLQQEGKTLHVAVIEPRSLAALSTGMKYKIVPWVAPEVRILEALETYYGVRRRSRYIRICRGLEQRPQAPPTATTHPGPAVQTQTAGAVESVPPSLQVTTVEGVGAEFGYGKNWKDVAAGLDEGLGANCQVAIDSGTYAAEERRDETVDAKTLRDAAELISRAETSQELARAVLGYASHRMTGSMVLGVKNETAQVWDWRGFELSPEKVKGLRFPVTSGSIFTLLLGKELYRGQVPDDPSCSCFYGALGTEPADDVLLLPVYVNDRLVALFYGEAREGLQIQGKTEDYQTLIQKLSLGLSMLILKHKIRAT